MEAYTEDWIETYEYYEEDERIQYKDSTYDIVSRVAYLIGVPRRIFDNPHEPPKPEIYDLLEKDRNARIIRQLCRVRAAIEQNFGKINDRMRHDFKSIYSLPEYVPKDALDRLALDGVDFYRKSSTKLAHHIIELNRIISDRINNCRSIFPVWLNWSYIRDIFIMKDGLTEAGTKAAANTYFSHKECYPYSIFINWTPRNDGNILYNDKKFVTLLYQWHNDYFCDYSKVSDAGSFVKSSIYEFIEDAGKVVMAVDCENSDPYRLGATLKGLDPAVTAKIRKIMLFDDVHTVDAWRILESHTSIPVEHIMTERVKQSKSLVDIELTAMTCREHYRDLVDSFIIVSSDSDYWGLISTLPDAKFLVMMEREKCGPDIKAAMANSGIFYCYIDDFYTGDGEDIKKNALFNTLNRTLDEALRLNVEKMLDDALTATRITMKPAERQQFYDKYIRNMRLVIDAQGNASLELNIK
ncbi:MAG: hypothetical protein IIV61_01745 [Oscillospiraceae bacterium]|nr:hypothetical protein [Oscillospiraceae bacterium]MBQ2382952.1 hypothetical protein [Oscillospiraceae bacterium]MBQ5711313.1 hypothetical protein [Oscillospiraceae bacterium]